MAQIKNINMTEFVGLEDVALIGLKNGRMVRTSIDNKFVTIEEKDKLVATINEHSAHIIALENTVKQLEKTIADLQTTVASLKVATSVASETAESTKTAKKSKKASE